MPFSSGHLVVVQQRSCPTVGASRGLTGMSSVLCSTQPERHVLISLLTLHTDALPSKLSTKHQPVSQTISPHGDCCMGPQGVPEVPYTVAYQGVPGAYSEVAALAACPGWRHAPCNNFESVFQVRASRCVPAAAQRCQRAALGLRESMGDGLAVLCLCAITRSAAHRSHCPLVV